MQSNALICKLHSIDSNSDFLLRSYLHFTFTFNVQYTLVRILFLIFSFLLGLSVDWLSFVISAIKCQQLQYLPTGITFYAKHKENENYLKRLHSVLNVLHKKCFKFTSNFIFVFVSFMEKKSTSFNRMNSFHFFIYLMFVSTFLIK